MDLEEELFDDIDDSDESHLYLRTDWNAIKSFTPPKAPKQTDKLKQMRLLSEGKMTELYRKEKVSLRMRIDNSVASMFCNHLLRQIQRPQPRIQSESNVYLFQSQILEKNMSSSIKNEDLDSMVETSLFSGSGVPELQLVINLYCLRSKQPDIKCQTVLDEFNSFLVTTLQEVQIHSFLALMLCVDDSLVPSHISKIRSSLGLGAPAHLYLFEQDPSLVFSIGRASSMLVRLLVMLYQPHGEEVDVEGAISALNKVLNIITSTILLHMPSLRSGKLNLNEPIAPLHEDASLVVRCAVEEAIAVPVYLGVLRPLYLADETFRVNDANIHKICSMWVASNNWELLLKKLEVSGGLIHSYSKVIAALKLAWRPSTTYGDGPTAKARMLVRACRLISIEAESSSIGADDILPSKYPCY